MPILNCKVGIYRLQGCENLNFEFGLPLLVARATACRLTCHPFPVERRFCFALTVYLMILQVLGRSSLDLSPMSQKLVCFSIGGIEEPSHPFTEQFVFLFYHWTYFLKVNTKRIRNTNDCLKTYNYT